MGFKHFDYHVTWCHFFILPPPANYSFWFDKLGKFLSIISSNICSLLLRTPVTNSVILLNCPSVWYCSVHLIQLFLFCISLWVVSLAMLSSPSVMVGTSPILVLLCCPVPLDGKGESEAPEQKETSTGFFLLAELLLHLPSQCGDRLTLPQQTSLLIQDRNESPWTTYFCVLRSGNAGSCSLSWVGHKILCYCFVFPILGSQHS